MVGIWSLVPLKDQSGGIVETGTSPSQKFGCGILDPLKLLVIVSLKCDIEPRSPEGLLVSQTEFVQLLVYS